MAVSIKHELEATSEHMRSLRGMIEWLRASGRLLETDAVVDPDLEITGVQKHFDGSYPILFKNVKGYPHLECVTNLYAKMDIIEDLFGWKDPQERTRRLAQAITHPIPPIEVPSSEAPCQETVITDDLNVNKWVMAIRHTALESEKTIGSGNSVVVGEYFHGGSHIGYNRMNARWGNVCTFQSAPGAHMWQIITEHYKDEKPIPLTMCFGLPPAATLIAGGGFDYVVLPRGGDELGAAGAVQGFPIRIVKARTVDAWAVADCDLVLEGHLYPRDKRYEIEEGWQRNFLAAILACNQGMRLTIAVDTDVDMYSMDDLMWCLTTRVNPHTDILNPIPGGIGQTFQPQERLTAGDKEWTASNTRFEGGMGIDATLPFGYEKDFQRPVYPIEKIDLGKWFASKDIERAKAQMRGWVESLARTGR